MYEMEWNVGIYRNFFCQTNRLDGQIAVIN